jgi:orotate phosphoribosyltransferase
MSSIAEEVAGFLLQVKAVRLSPDRPFTWASGWKSPIYCDNRRTLSFPAARTFIRDGLTGLIREKFPEAEVVAGVATGAIAQGALVAQELGLPFAYVRGATKGHGLENLIEGECRPGQRVVVVEDLVSTGGSSLQAVRALRDAGCVVSGMVAIFTYGFKRAREGFAAAGCALETLCDYEAMIGLAVERGYVLPGDAERLRGWRESPETYEC